MPRRSAGGLRNMAQYHFHFARSERRADPPHRPASPVGRANPLAAKAHSLSRLQAAAVRGGRPLPPEAHRFALGLRSVREPRCLGLGHGVRQAGASQTCFADRRRPSQSANGRIKLKPFMLVHISFGFFIFILFYPPLWCRLLPPQRPLNIAPFEGRTRCLLEVYCVKKKPTVKLLRYLVRSAANFITSTLILQSITQQHTLP